MITLQEPKLPGKLPFNDIVFRRNHRNIGVGEECFIYNLDSHDLHLGDVQVDPELMIALGERLSQQLHPAKAGTILGFEGTLAPEQIIERAIEIRFEGLLVALRDKYGESELGLDAKRLVDDLRSNLSALEAS